MMLKQLVLPTAILTAMAFTPVMADSSGSTGGSKADAAAEERTGTQGYTAGNQSAQAFDELDKNQDGKLDEDELNAWGSTAAGPDAAGEGNSIKAEQMLERYDQDGDGTLSRDELQHAPYRGSDSSTDSRSTTPGSGTGSGMTM